MKLISEQEEGIIDHRDYGNATTLLRLNINATEPNESSLLADNSTNFSSCSSSSFHTNHTKYENDGKDGKNDNEKNGKDKSRHFLSTLSKISSSEELVRLMQVQYNILMASPTISRILSPPTLACGLGLLVGTSPLRYLFIANMGGGTSANGNSNSGGVVEAPLSPLFNSLRTMGGAYVPAVLLVLAGSLSKGLQGFRIREMLPQLAAIMTVRFIFLPIIVITCVATLLSMGVLPADPIFLFVIVLESCMPPAQNTVLILQLEKDYEGAIEIARLISVVYVMAVLPLALLLKMILTNIEI